MLYDEQHNPISREFKLWNLSKRQGVMVVRGQSYLAATTLRQAATVVARLHFGGRWGAAVGQESGRNGSWNVGNLAVAFRP